MEPGQDPTALRAFSCRSKQSQTTQDFLGPFPIVADVAISATFQLDREINGADSVELVKRELSKLSEAKKAYANEVMELETFIDTHPKPKEVRQKIEKGLLEFKTLWAKSTGSQKKRLIGALFDGLLMYPGKLGVIPPMNNSGDQNEKGARGRDPSISSSSPKNSNVISLPARVRIPFNTTDGSLSVDGASTDKSGGE